jgi:hypothetical protein
VSIDETADESATLALLWSLFGARSDVYAVRWESASTGNAGWSLATKGGWLLIQVSSPSPDITADPGSHRRPGSLR